MKKLVYLAAKQALAIAYFVQAITKVVVMIMGRGAGKSVTIAEYIVRCCETMPRASGALVGATVEIIENRTLPAVTEHWERMGYVEGEHYLIGKKPAASWAMPYARPKDWSKTILWHTGAVVLIISTYSKNRVARGLSIQFVVADEAALIDEGTWNQNLMPTIRGNRFRVAHINPPPQGDVPFGTIEDGVWVIPFRENPFYLSQLIVSSMPWLEKGKWILKYEDDPNACFITGTALDNYATGREYYERLRASLTDIEFRIEVKNELVEQLPDGFYPEYSDEKHIVQEDYYSSSGALEMSWDFGRFNCCIVGQVHGDTVHALSTHYKLGSTVDAVVDEVREAYGDHRNKVMHVFGDRNGNNTQANSKLTLYQEIQKKLEADGWTVVSHVRGLDPPHADRHMFMNRMLVEKQEQLPRLRIFWLNKALVVALKQCGIREGFKKDKRPEHPNSSTPPEHAPHLTDCLDNWLYPKYRRLLHAAAGGEVGEVYF